MNDLKEKNGVSFQVHIHYAQGCVVSSTLADVDADEERPSIKKIDPYYQLWYRRQKALPIFEAYMHAELERYKLEQKLAEAKK